MDRANVWAWAVVYGCMIAVIMAVINLFFPIMSWSTFGIATLTLVAGFRYVALPSIYKRYGDYSVT